MDFRFLTGFSFNITIADDLSAFSCPEGLVSNFFPAAFSSFQSLRTEFPILPFRCDPMLRIFRTGCYTPFAVTGIFFITSLSFRTGPAVFRFPAKIHLFITIAGGYEAFFCPEGPA